MSIHVETHGAEISATELVVLNDLGKVLALLHRDRLAKEGNAPTMATMASGLVGMLASRSLQETDPDAYAVILGCAALLYLESGAAVVAEIPAAGKMH